MPSLLNWRIETLPKHLTHKDFMAIVFLGAAPAAAFVLMGALEVRLALPVALAVACSSFAGIVLICYRSLLLSLQLHIDQIATQGYRESRNSFRQVEALLHLQKLIQYRHPLPSMRGWPICPDFAVLLASEIVRRKPEIIVELGCGTSTLISGYCLEKLGRGRVESLDHERTFADICRENLKVHGLEGFAVVHEAPLCDLELGGKSWRYYDISPLRGIPPIDMLVVDGPPGELGRLARYPALPLLYERLSESAVILVDDADRADERAMVGMWVVEHPDFECTFLETEEGAAILRRRAGRRR